MDERSNLPLEELVAKIIEQLKNASFSPKTIGLYKRFFNRLLKMASSMGKEVFDRELADCFVADNAYQKTGEYNHTRYLYHVRCIRFIESYISAGTVDFSISQLLPAKELRRMEFKLCLNKFKETMVKDGLKPNTIDGYLRFVYYFLSYLEDKGHTSLSEVQMGDITLFMVLVCQEHYAPTSIGSHLTGLRRFVQLFPELRDLAVEIPEHVPRKTIILPSYTEEEHKKIDDFLVNGKLSARNRAIAHIAFDTGLRAVDICAMKLEDIDWEHDVISIIQAKTKKPMRIPIRPALGNALMAYLLEERPASDLPYVFLRSNAPFNPLADHSGIYNVLRKMLAEADVEPDGRISGTRMARHSHATRMLRNGVPLPVISEALGHSSPNSTMRYLSTDERSMSVCTLPLPKGGALL